MTPSYLIEHTYVTTTGTVQGKTLRAYEVIAELTTDKRGYKRYDLKPTGILYTVKDGAILQKKTKATLSSKYLNNSREVQHTMPDRQNWGCSLFSTPELALHYKASLICSQTTSVIAQLQAAIDTASATLATIPDTSFIISQHPELFI